MTQAIFLSAGVPDPKRGPRFAKTADTVAITSAVSALIFVTLGRRRLVWGGQPAIAPMIWVVAEALDVDYSSWVHLYQTIYFEDAFPEDNKRFSNVTYTENVENNMEKSLLHMREQMFSENEFDAAVFIGGMAGILEEFELFQSMQSKAVLVPVVSTGGAVLDIAKRLDLSADLAEDRDYVALMHRYLGISISERRFRTPMEQPSDAAERLWVGPNPGGQSCGAE